MIQIMSASDQGKSLGSRVMRAGFWSLTGYGLSQAIRLGSNLVMTRLLVPEMFGVMSVVMIVIVGLYQFSDLGLRQSIVQSKRGGDATFLNTVWIVQILRGLLIWGAALLVSVGFYIAGTYGWLPNNSAYSAPLLPLAIAIAAFSQVIAGFESTGIASAARRLAQTRIAVLEVSSQLVGFAVMLCWALVDRSIWALVAGTIAASLARTILSQLILSSVRPRLEWDPTAFKEVFHFGKWLFLSSVLGFLLNCGDRLLLAGLIDTKTFGYYSIAFLMLNAVQTAFSRINSSVAFPAFSEVFRHRAEELKATYYKFRLRLDAGILLVAGFFMIAGSKIIDLLYDARYAEAGPMLQILSTIFLAQRYSLADQCYMAMGKPKLLTLLIVIQLVSLYSLVPLGFYFFGFKGALWAIVFSYFTSVPTTVYFKKKLGILDIRKELTILPVLLIGVALGGLFSLVGR